MDKYNFENDINTFGVEVKNFPAGVDEAFNELITKTGDAAGKRNYYGVSNMDSNGKMIYKALAEEKYKGEAKEYAYEQITIEKGDYYFEVLKDWRTKTTCIKDIFNEMMNDKRIDKTKPAVEWYKNDEEMWCMVKAI